MTEGRIKFFYETRNFLFRDRRKVKSFLLDLFRSEGRPLEELNYIFCTDAYLLAINREFLQHDTLTDIITFQLSHPSAPITAEVYISIERVKENAITHASPFHEELLRVIIHGALHLCGYDDKTRKLKAQMSKKEDEFLGKYSVSRGMD
jgi:rRNA maturation RNase YbeY